MLDEEVSSGATPFGETRGGVGGGGVLVMEWVVIRGGSYGYLYGEMVRAAKWCTEASRALDREFGFRTSLSARQPRV